MNKTTLTNGHVSAWIELAKTYNSLLHKIESALKEQGLPSLSWYDLLLELRKAESEGLRPYQLQEAMLLPQYNISRLIDRVAKAGYAEKKLYKADGRGQVIKITTQGQALLKKIWPIYKSILEATLASSLSQSEATNLTRMLKKINPQTMPPNPS